MDQTMFCKNHRLTPSVLHALIKQGQVEMVGGGGGKTQLRSFLPLKVIYTDGNPNLHVIKRWNHYPTSRHLYLPSGDVTLLLTNL